MIFIETRLKGAFLIEPELIHDDRGFFSRSFCENEFRVHGLETKIAQCNISMNKKKTTIRGMHYQISPHEEAKLVRCTKGSLFDVIIDLRPKSPTYKEWFGIELTDENHKMLYIPRGFAHGFQTLQDNTEVFYHMFELYHPQSARGVLWNDPCFGIEWPLKNPIVSEKDRSYKEFDL